MLNVRCSLPNLSSTSPTAMTGFSEAEPTGVGAFFERCKVEKENGKLGVDAGNGVAGKGVIVEGPSTNRAQTALAPIRGLKLGEWVGAGRCQLSTKPYPLGAE